MAFQLNRRPNFDPDYPLTVVKPFQSNGVQYKNGDPYKGIEEGVDPRAVMKLYIQRFINHTSELPVTAIANERHLQTVELDVGKGDVVTTADGEKTVEEIVSNTEAVVSPPPERRRGRPPGSKNKVTKKKKTVKKKTQAKRGRPTGSTNKKVKKEKAS